MDIYAHDTTMTYQLQTLTVFASTCCPGIRSQGKVMSGK